MWGGQRRVRRTRRPPQLQPSVVTAGSHLHPAFTNLLPTAANSNPKPPVKRPFLTLSPRRLPPRIFPPEPASQAGFPASGCRVPRPGAHLLGESSPRALFLPRVPAPGAHRPPGPPLSRTLSQVPLRICLLGSLTLDSFPLTSLHSRAFSPIDPPQSSQNQPP